MNDLYDSLSSNRYLKCSDPFLSEPLGGHASIDHFVGKQFNHRELVWSPSTKIMTKQIQLRNYLKFSTYRNYYRRLAALQSC